jgi:hypothetical protein
MLGVSVKDSDGTMRSNYEILGDLAEQFKNMPDGIGKATAAQQLFGKTGANLIPLLNSGKAAVFRQFPFTIILKKEVQATPLQRVM